MATAKNRRIKQITLVIGGVSYECQITSYEVQNNTPDGELVRTLCPDGAFVDLQDEDWALNIKGLHDWAVAGISRAMLAANQTSVAFTLVHLKDVPAEDVQIAGNLWVKASNIGGERGARDEFDWTFPLIDFNPAVGITYPA